jgi:thioredoxin-dependent peroxiredoxin
MASAKKTQSAPSKRPTNKAKQTTTSAKPAAKKKSTKAVPKARRALKVVKAKPAAKSVGKSEGIGAGDRAPSFKLKDQAGKELSSSALAGSPYVIYFYPKDDTTGCTKEACGFRDAFRSFGQKRARVIGVSADSEASHARFVAKYGLPFTLLADPDKVLANAYGVWVKKQNYGREYMGILRSTFVVDEKGVVQKAWRGVKVDGHVDKVLEAVKSL